MTTRNNSLEEDTQIEEEHPDTPLADTQPPTTPLYQRSVAPTQRSAIFRHFIGLALACLAAYWAMGIPSFIDAAPKGGYSFGELVEFVLSPNLIWTLFVFLLVLGFGDLGNFINTPRNHVAKIYQPFGLSGSQQLIAFSLSERGWKPIMKRQGWGWVPFSIFLDIYYFPWPRVPSNQIAYIISNIGQPLGSGRRTAISMDVELYADVSKFVDKGGELGIQRTILTPGFFREIDPVGFTVITGDENGIYGYLTDPDLRAKQDTGTLKWTDFGGFAGTTDDIFMPTVIKDDEQGIVTILDGDSLPGGQLVHRFGGFEDIKTLLEGAGLNSYKRHIEASHDIKEALDRVAHIKADIEGMNLEKAEIEALLLERDNSTTEDERKKEIEDRLTKLTKLGTEHRLAQIGEEITRLQKELLEHYELPADAPTGTILPDKSPKRLIAQLEAIEGMEGYGKIEAREWETLLNQGYDAKADIFKHGRKFEMHLCQRLLKVALDSKLELHNSFQNLAAYFDQNGRQGPQWDTLKPGKYNHNKFVVKVEKDEKKLKRIVVKEGTVVVIKSDVGLTGEDITHRRFNFGSIVRPGFRGIWLATLPPGTYRFNTSFLHPIVVPTAMVTLFWGEGTRALTLDGDTAALDAELKPVVTITKDGYRDIRLNIDAQMIFPAEAAAIIIASFGSVRDLVKGFISAKLSAFSIEVVRSRDIKDLIEGQLQVQEEIAKKLIEQFSSLEIQVKAVLIQEIKGADVYLAMRERRVIALREKDAVQAEAEVEVSRKDQYEKAGAAERAFELAVSEADKTIAKNTNEMVKTLFKELPELTGEAGNGLRDGLSRGAALHYLKRAVGEKAAAMIQVVDLLTKSGQPITPSVLVGDKGSLLEALMGDLLKEGSVKGALEEYKRSLLERGSRQTTSSSTPSAGA